MTGMNLYDKVVSRQTQSHSQWTKHDDMLLEIEKEQIKRELRTECDDQLSWVMLEQFTRYRLSGQVF